MTWYNLVLKYLSLYFLKAKTTRRRAELKAMVQEEFCRKFRVVCDCTLPQSHNLHKGKAAFQPKCCPAKQASMNAIPSFCYKRATISYVDAVVTCPTRFPAYIRWTSEPKPCNKKLVQIVWKKSTFGEKHVDLMWASECAKKKVEICWMKDKTPPATKREVSMSWLTRRGDYYKKEMSKCQTSLQEDRREKKSSGQCEPVATDEAPLNKPMKSILKTHGDGWWEDVRKFRKCA